MKLVVKLTIPECAQMVQKPVATLYRWKKNQPELFAIVWRGCLETKLDGVRHEQA